MHSVEEPGQTVYCVTCACTTTILTDCGQQSHMKHVITRPIAMRNQRGNSIPHKIPRAKIGHVGDETMRESSVQIPAVS